MEGCDNRVQVNALSIGILKMYRTPFPFQWKKRVYSIIFTIGLLLSQKMLFESWFLANHIQMVELIEKIPNIRLAAIGNSKTK